MKLYAYLAAALLLGIAALYVNRLQHKAGRVDAAEAHSAQLERDKAELATTFAKATETNRAIATDLAAFRAEQSAASLSFTQALKSKSLIRETIREVNGVQVTCPERDAQRYFELYNRAVTGTATSP